ncbi:MAG: hypothetical protein ABIG84_07690 [archaeon]
MDCQGKTKEGRHCNNNASDGSKFCHQHIDGLWNKITYFLADFFGCKRRFLLWTFLFAIVIFLIQLHITYQYNQVLDNLKLKPDVEIEISPFLYKAEFGEYLPMIITNIGDYTFNEVYVAFHSCNMPKSHYEQYYLPLIPAHSERIIPMGNKDVVNKFKMGNCYPFAGENKSIPSFFPSLRDSKNQTSIGCTYCHFNAKVYAGYYRNNRYEIFKKNISSYFYSPGEITMEVL